MDEDQIVVVPIEDTIDLHTFSPRDVPLLLEDYFEACLEKGITEVRVIHGKGKGQLKARVHAFLERCPRVESYSLAGPNWGATVVRLRWIEGKTA